MSKKIYTPSKERRAVVVAGLRTPFVKAFAEFLELDTIALGDACVSALLDKTQIDRDAIDVIVWGGVILPGLAPNVAREIALDLRLPARVEGHTVTRACASGLDRKSTRLNSSHLVISYAVFCLKKKTYPSSTSASESHG